MREGEQHPTIKRNGTGGSSEAHRGRVQAQGGGTEKSAPWAQEKPLTRNQGFGKVDERQAQLTPRELRDRQEPLEKTREWIERAALAGGVNAPVSKTFKQKGSKDIRVDIEVKAGQAFIPD
ncbi:hypothetical protein FJZ31_27005 [Candidatus Poribacteria bacterium]|nr:hypothetical protein [Candidatus Poribacteria bacterium]